MKNSFSIVFLLIGFAMQAQVTGNKNIINKKRDLENFSEIQIYGDFEVSLKKGSKSFAEVEADENVHDFIVTDIANGVLTLKPSKEIRKAKKQEIHLEFPETITRIVLHNKASLDASKSLSLGDVVVETNDKSKLYLTLNATSFSLKNNADAQVELNLETGESYFQLNGGSKIKALVTAQNLKVESYQKSSAAIEGTIEQLILSSDHTSKFEGKNLSSKTATITAEGRSKNEVAVSETLDFTGGNKSETTIYGTPTMTIKSFTGEAVLKKAEK